MSKLDNDIMRCDVIIVRRCQHCSAISSLFGDVNIVRRCQHCSAMSTLFGDVIIVRRCQHCSATTHFACSSQSRMVSRSGSSSAINICAHASTYVVLRRVLIRLYQLLLLGSNITVLIELVPALW